MAKKIKAKEMIDPTLTPEEIEQMNEDELRR